MDCQHRKSRFLTTAQGKIYGLPTQKMIIPTLHNIPNEMSWCIVYPLDRFPPAFNNSDGNFLSFNYLRMEMIK